MNIQYCKVCGAPYRSDNELYYHLQRNSSCSRAYADHQQKENAIQAAFGKRRW